MSDKLCACRAGEVCGGVPDCVDGRRDDMAIVRQTCGLDPRVNTGAEGVCGDVPDCVDGGWDDMAIVRQTCGHPRINTGGVPDCVDGRRDDMAIVWQTCGLDPRVNTGAGGVCGGVPDCVDGGRDDMAIVRQTFGLDLRVNTGGCACVCVCVRLKGCLTRECPRSTTPPRHPPNHPHTPFCVGVETAVGL